MRRYIIHTPPVQHLNGKLAPASQVVHNSADSSESSDSAFYYGYHHAKRPNVSRYALRDKPRNLTAKPYTTGEARVKDNFRTNVYKAHELLRDERYRATIRKAFNKQRHYIRLFNYTLAMLVQHNGNLPKEWIRN